MTSVFTPIRNYTYASVEEDSVIKANGIIPSMFLQEHYDYEAENVREAVCAFDEISEHEADLDMGFELLDDEWELEIWRFELLDDEWELEI